MKQLARAQPSSLPTARERMSRRQRWRRRPQDQSYQGKARLSIICTVAVIIDVQTTDVPGVGLDGSRHARTELLAGSGTIAVRNKAKRAREMQPLQQAFSLSSRADSRCMFALYTRARARARARPLSSERVCARGEGERTDIRRRFGSHHPRASASPLLSGEHTPSASAPRSPHSPSPLL